MSTTDGEDKLVQIESYEEHMTPFYSEVRRRILGELALTGNDPDTLRNRDKQERANVALITRLLTKLPSPEEESDKSRNWGAQLSKLFTLEDPSLVPLIQASTIWIQGGEGREYNGYQPFYIVGDNKSSDVKKRSLLLADTSKSKHNDTLRNPGVYKLSSNPLRSKRTLKKFYDKIDSIGSLAASSSADGIVDIYSRDTGLFTLGSVHPDSFVLDALYNEEIIKQKFVSFDEMDEFGVYDHLSELAARFDTSDAFAKIIADHFKDIK